MLSTIFKYQNSIISKYLLSILVLVFFGIFFIISIIVFGNQFVLTVQESVEHGIPIKELMPLIGFNMLRDIPIILTLSMFLSIIITISQLYKNSEAIVMNSIGMGDRAFLSIIQPVAIFLFLLVLFLTSYLVPWAKNQKSIAEQETKNSSEFSFITEGKFESFKEGNIVFYASESLSIDENGEQNMEEVFIYAYEDGLPIIVLASEAKKYIDVSNKNTYLRLNDGVRYQGLPSDENVNIMNFDQYELEIVSSDAIKSIINISKIEEISTLDLVKKGGLLAAAEIQWRLSLPLSILVLVAFGVYLGKTSPRGGKGVNILIGIIVFMLYNHGLLVAKSSIENGTLNPLIGMWSIHLSLFLFLIIFHMFREGKISYFFDKINFLNKKEKNYV